MGGLTIEVFGALAIPGHATLWAWPSDTPAPLVPASLVRAALAMSLSSGDARGRAHGDGP